MSTDSRSRTRNTLLRPALFTVTIGGLLAAFLVPGNAQQSARPDGYISGVVESASGPRHPRQKARE